MITHDKGVQGIPNFCSVARTKRYLQHRCVGYLEYVVDTRVKKKKSIVNMPIVGDYIDVFPKDLMGFLPKRQVEFEIDSVPSVVPKAKLPYSHAPTEMLELST